MVGCIPMKEAVNNVYLRKLADIQVLYTSFTSTEIWYKCVPNQPPSLLHSNMIFYLFTTDLPL
jgi:hypothetical protein